MTDAFVKVANKSDLLPGAIKAIEVNGQKIALCQAGDSFYAVGDTCSHAKVALDGGDIIDEQIECPKHGARFDLKTGQAMCPPAIQPIPIYPLEIRGEEIWVAVPENK
jgi:3-phenylpropionate/trans-cinnamate dioxygenase ferredoxin subunit